MNIKGKKTHIRSRKFVNMSAADYDHSPHKAKEATFLYDSGIGNQQPTSHKYPYQEIEENPISSLLSPPCCKIEEYYSVPAASWI